MTLNELQQALPTWVRLERKPGEAILKKREVGDLDVVEINAYPETPPRAAVRADVHFLLVAPTEGFPEQDELVNTIVDACKDGGEFAKLSPGDLNKGPSYIELGAWLGSQDLALMLIGAVELAGIARAITPAIFGIPPGEQSDAMAGLGMVLLGPSDVWDAKGGEDGEGSVGPVHPPEASTGGDSED